MYTYAYERISGAGFFTFKFDDHREVIDSWAQDGWRYAGFIPAVQKEDGLVVEIDLIFEKEM